MIGICDMTGTSVMKELKDGANGKLFNPLMNNVEKWTNLFQKSDGV